MQVAAMADYEPRMLLKTIRALTRPNGFESHALRSTCQTSPDLGGHEDQHDSQMTRQQCAG
jgi:hypothetical protein